MISATESSLRSRLRFAGLVSKTPTNHGRPLLHPNITALLFILSTLYPKKSLNPCPCGYYGDSLKPCTCAPALVTKYQKRISSPMLDRMDIHIEVPRVDYQKLSSDRLGEASADIRAHVEAARERQCVRFAKSVNMVSNSDMRVAEVRQFCKLDETGESLVRVAMSQMQLSARAYHRILKLARTIADLAGSDRIESVHLAEALQYRPKLNMM
jgi:magnesium chelatase family protein